MDELLPGVDIAQRSFDMSAQLGFARVSGDRNPLHIDPEFARRSQYGAPIVHGMHYTMWALEALAGSFGNRSLSRLSARFLKPIYCNEVVTLRLVRFSAERLRLAIELDGVAISTINLELSEGLREKASRPYRTDLLTSEATIRCETTFSNTACMRGSINLRGRSTSTAELFARTARWIGAEQVAALAALSRLVGMECPGKYSLFSGFTVQFAGEECGDKLDYAVVSSNPELRVLRIDVSGSGISGTVEAFARHPPAIQAITEVVKLDVSSNEFGNAVALVIGGSRGLGEATAKILATGGAHVIITYATGRADAESVAAQITAAGGRCSMIQYDAMKPAAPQLDSIVEIPHTVYYFATGPIFDRKLHMYDPERFRRFCRYYVDGFADLCSTLTTLTKEPLAVFYPSSTAIENRARDLTEYVMAKAAGELLCADLVRSVPQLHISVSRLPRTRTDQTAGIADVPASEAHTILLPLIRALQSGSATARR